MSLKTVIFSALPYATAKLHIGRVLSAQYSADVYRRFLAQFCHEKAVHYTGLDCHGSAVYLQALKHKLSPLNYCKLKKREFLKQLRFLNIIPDAFLLTTDKKHKNNVYEWYANSSRVFRETTEGNYCAKCDTFLADRFLVDMSGETYQKVLQANQHTQISPETSWYCGRCKERTQLKTYSGVFVRLDERFKEEIKLKHPKVYEQYNLEVSPNYRQISRKDCPWGIPIPEEISCNFYVWIEALKAYQTLTLNQSVGKAVFCYGKDNAYYHCYLLNAVLNKPFKSQLHLVKNYLLTSKKTKMSSSDTSNALLVASQLGLTVQEIRYCLAKNDTLLRDRQINPVVIEHAKREYANLFGIKKRILGFKNIPKKSVFNAKALPVPLSLIIRAYHRGNYSEVVALVNQELGKLNVLLTRFFQRKDPTLDLASVLKTHKSLLNCLAPITSKKAY